MGSLVLVGRCYLSDDLIRPRRRTQSPQIDGYAQLPSQALPPFPCRHLLDLQRQLPFHQWKNSITSHSLRPLPLCGCVLWTSLRPAIYRGGRALRGPPSVAGPILLRFTAFLQQTLAGLLDAPPPVDRQQAKGEIRATHIRPLATVRRRCFLYTTLITRPPLRSPSATTTDPTPDHRNFPRRHQAGSFQLPTRYHLPYPRFQNLHGWKLRHVTPLEIHAPGHPRGSRSTTISASALPQPTRQLRPSPLRPHDQIVLPLDGPFQHLRHPPPHLVYRLPASIPSLVPIQIGPSHIEPGHSELRESVQHPPSLLHPPPVFLYTHAGSPAVPLRCGRHRLAVPQRFICLSRHPQPMQQHRQLARHRDHRPLFPILPSPLADPLSKSPQVAILTMRSQDVVRTVHQGLAQIPVPRLGDPQLRFLLPRVLAPRPHPQKAPHRSALLESCRIAYRQHER